MNYRPRITRIVFETKEQADQFNFINQRTGYRLQRRTDWKEVEIIGGTDESLFDTLEMCGGFVSTTTFDKV